MKWRIRHIAMAVGIGIFLITALQVQAQDWDQIYNLKGMWKFSIGDNQKWADPNYQDEDWESIYVPSTWEDEGFYGFDGYAWYRKTFDGSQLPRDNNIYLHLGYIDDVDQVFFNGELIGSSGNFPPKYSTAYNAFRKYLIPKDLINFSGINTIAVRVYDATQAGGIVDGRVGLYINRDALQFDIDLMGIWKFQIRDEEARKEVDYDDSEWTQIMVPAPWERQGYYRYDGMAWYRRTFYLPKELAQEELYLILGKIDDYDHTYVNGYLIGSTKDYQHYGSSGSYSQLRSYYIPNEILKAGQDNVIAVRVEDIGGEGGIYEGPVGIIQQSKFTKFWRHR